MAYRYSQLIGIRDYAKETKDRISNLYGMICSNDIPVHTEENTPEYVFDDIEHACDDVIKYCNEQLKLLDARKENEAVGSISPRCSRWY